MRPQLRLVGDEGACARPGCPQRIGRLETLVGDTGRPWRLFVVGGRWAYADDAWRHDRDARPDLPGDWSRSPWYLVLPATIA